MTEEEKKMICECGCEMFFYTDIGWSCPECGGPLPNEKKWEEGFEEWFRPQDPEPKLNINPSEQMIRDYNLLHREWNMRFFSAKLGYLQACQEMEKLKSNIKRHEEVIREEFGHAITEADEVLWKEAK